MEEFSRLTFLDGLAPAIDGNLVMCMGSRPTGSIMVNATVYAFDKRLENWCGFLHLEWAKDSSFSPLHFDDLEDGRRVFTLGLAVATLCALMRWAKRWRYQMSHEESIRCRPSWQGHFGYVHGKENIDKTSMGRMVSIKKPTVIPSGAELPMVLSEKDVNWKQDYEAF